MCQDFLKLSGKITVKKNDELVLEKNNLIVTAGKTFVAAALGASSTSPFTHMGIGSGTTAAVIGDTDLETSIVRQVFGSVTPVANVITFVTTYAAGTGTGTITEAGLFNAASAGTMLSRVVFGAISKGAADSLQITWEITVG